MLLKAVLALKKTFKTPVKKNKIQLLNADVSKTPCWNVSLITWNTNIDTDFTVLICSYW